MGREEGISQWYRGLGALVGRGMCVTAGQFTTYDVAKRFLVETAGCDANRVTTHLVASTTAGTVSAMIVNPMDVVKTRMMASQKARADAKEGIVVYRSNWDCVVKLMKTEGPLAFYKGLTPCFLRQCPQVILMWTIFEQYKKWYKLLTTK